MLLGLPQQARKLTDHTDDLEQGLPEEHGRGGGASIRKMSEDEMSGVIRVETEPRGARSSEDCGGAGAAAPEQILLPLFTQPMGDDCKQDEHGLPHRPSHVRGCRRDAWMRLRRVSAWSGAMKKMSPGVREYYQNLYTTIDKFREADGYGADFNAVEPSVAPLIYASFVANLFIFAVKVVAAISSGSLVVYASAMDSFLDLLAGSILAATAMIMARPNRQEYPVGKARMEGLGVIFLAAVMSTSYCQVIIEALQRLTMPPQLIVLDTFMLFMLLGVVLVKGILYFICQAALRTMTQKSVSLEAQAGDHFNDCITNFCSAVGTFLASALFSETILHLSPTALTWVDPVVAILFSAYVIYNWTALAKENMTAMVGKTAPAMLMSTITYLAVVHCSEVKCIENVVCYSHGQQYIAEVDIVLPPTMTVLQSHAIAESLQLAIERLDDIERCFVHIDHEVEHSHEHKM